MSTTDTVPDDAAVESIDGEPGLGEPGSYEKPEWLTLDPDEEIIWVGEPVLLSLISTIIAGVVLIPFLIGILILLASPFSYLTIKNTDFVVTTKSLYVKKGVVSTNIETVDIDKIQNTEYSQSFWGKQFDYADIDVSTAGSSGAEITFSAIANARAVRERISELGNRARNKSGVAAGECADSRPRDDRLDDLVAELRATREAMERIEAKMGGDGPATDDAGAGVDTANASADGAEPKDGGDVLSERMDDGQ